ncbi:MAG: glycosyltransferase family 39 protein [Candidatus Kerfeldbacteria bacterium]|nr:glycosyltransferase family 39 protein [Candidatus Kerfeldbacteria bacterium]
MASATLSNGDRWRGAAAVGLCLVILVGFWSVGASKDFWYDEQFVRTLVDQPMTETIKLLKFENSPPFTFAVVYWWEKLVGSSEVALRVLSLGPTLLGIVVLSRFARAAFGRTSGLVVAGLASVASLAVTQALELRMYPWVLLWSTSALFLVHQYASKPRATALIALTVVHVLGLYTHYTYVVVVVASGVWLWWGARVQRRAIALHAAVVAVLFLPWVLYSLVPIAQHWTTSLGVQQDRNLLAIALFPLRLFAMPLFGEPNWLTVVRFMVAAIIGLGILWSLRLLLRPTDDRSVVVLRWLFGLVVGGLLVLALAGFSDPKYATVLVPAVIAVVAVGLVRLPLPGAVRAVLIVLAVVGELVVSYAHARAPLVTYREATAVVERVGQTGDVIVVHPFNDDIVVRNYYHGSLPVYGFLPDRPPGGATLEDNVRRNFRVQVNEANVGELSAYVGQASRVWFFYDVTIGPSYWNGHLIDRWFRDHGFDATVYRSIFRRVPPLLVRYDRIESGNRP